MSATIRVPYCSVPDSGGKPLKLHVVELAERYCEVNPSLRGRAEEIAADFWKLNSYYRWQHVRVSWRCAFDRFIRKWRSKT